MLFYSPVQLSLCNGWSPGIFSILLRLCLETQQTPSVTAHMDVPSWRTWTASATWLSCRYHLMLPVVTRTLAEHKTTEVSVRKDKVRAIVCGHHMQNHFFCGVLSFCLSIVSVVTLICRWNCFTITWSFKQTDWYPWSWTALVLYCDESFSYLFWTMYKRS